MISINGGSDPTSVSFNGVNLTGVYARQGPSGTYVQVWPSQFTLTMTGECVVFPGFRPFSQYGWGVSDSSDYQLNGTVPGTVQCFYTEYDTTKYPYAYKLNIYDECGDLLLADTGNVPTEFGFQELCQEERVITNLFKDLFPDNFSGSWATNLSDTYCNAAWLGCVNCCLPIQLNTSYGDFRYCGAFLCCFFNCCSQYGIQNGSNFSICFYSKVSCRDFWKFRIAAKMTNGCIFKTDYCYPNIQYDGNVCYTCIKSWEFKPV